VLSPCSNLASQSRMLHSQRTNVYFTAINFFMKPIQAAFTAGDIAGRVGASLLGDATLRITSIAPSSAPTAGALAFIRAKTQKAALQILNELPAMAVLIEPSAVPAEPIRSTLQCTLLVVANPQRALLGCIPLFFEQEVVTAEIHPTAVIHTSARIGQGVTIGAYSVLGAGVVVGDGAVLHEHVSLYRDSLVGDRTELHSGVIIREGCRVGSDCIIHNHVVIGADGFGYLADPTKGIEKVPQVGIAIVGNHVEIGVGTAIDRAAIGVTSIGDHTKLDNHVQVGHNVQIGSHCMICAQVGIAGSVQIGDGVILGGGTGVADHVTICSGVRVGGHSGVTSSIEEPGDYAGMPIVKASQFRRQQAALKRLAQRASSS
jgi:UDP-3-O-[3-hydroxymyristoyl] glucosamine N-acyltransferase